MFTKNSPISGKREEKKQILSDTEGGEVPDELEEEERDYRAESTKKKSGNKSLLQDSYKRKMKVFSAPGSGLKRPEKAKINQNYSAAKSSKSKKSTKSSTSNQDYLMSLLSHSSKLISVFRQKQSFVHETRSSVLQQPKKSFRRSPERLEDMSRSPLRQSPKHPKFTINSSLTSPYKRGRMLPTASSSLLITRRKLSPCKEVQRDDFIDTADLVLTKEISLIAKLNKVKEDKMGEIEHVKMEIENEQKRITKIQALQPKIIKKIQQEHDVGVDYTQQIDDLEYLIDQERNNKIKYEHEYYRPLMGKFFP